jgi:DNA-binding CsgD family transcriptional regulator
MDSDDFVRFGRQVDNGFNDGPTASEAVSSRENVVNRTEFSSVISGLQNLLANSGVRIVANKSHRVVWATTNAAALASANSCITFATGELAGRTGHSNALLRDLFDEAERVAPEGVELLMGPDPSSSPELFFRAQIFHAAGAPFTVFTIRSLARELQEIPNLRHLYGLTRAEQKIIGMMIQGKSATEIADGLRKSVLTIRSHLKRAYGKLNISSKEQLFSMILKLMVT